MPSHATSCVALLVADWTRRDDAITALLEAHGRSGVPLYLYFTRRVRLRCRSLLPQVLTPERRACGDLEDESVMSVKLYAFGCGEVIGDLGNFIEGGSGRISVPVPAYLIDHPKGKVVFDTGLNIGVRQDAARLLGPITAKQYDVDLPPDADIASRLVALDIDPASIRYTINSHLHRPLRAMR